MEAPKRPKPSRRKIGHTRSKVKANATKAANANASKTSKLTVAERVNKRKQLSKVQHEIEGIMRELEHANGLTEIVKLRKQLSLKDEERDMLYKETMDMNAQMNKPKTLKERRTKKKPEIRPRINATTLKLRERKALNLERMYQLKKEEEFGPEDETADILKEMQPWVKPKVEYVSEKAYYSMKEEDDVPKELRSMVVRDKPPLKKRPKPKQANVSL